MDVWEEYFVSIFRVELYGKKEKWHDECIRLAGFLLRVLFDPEDVGYMLFGNVCSNRATCSTVVSCLGYFSTLKMEKTCSSETSNDFQLTEDNLGCIALHYG
jgi:hypothetical protein